MSKYPTGHRGASIFRFFLLISCLSTPALAADDYLCEARQNSREELPLLSASCPVGKALWGKAPRTDTGSFWIQCGIFSEPISPAHASGIYANISTDVWLKREGSGYRCLIGPYEHFGQARQELDRVRTLSTYKDAFIRQVASVPVKKEPIARKKAIPPQMIVPQPPSDPEPKPFFAAREEKRLRYGYSYMTLGIENVVYKETFPNANSEVTINSPILNTGGLYRINDWFDFSIDALATFSPQDSTEEWADDDGNVYQNNKLEYMRAATNIQLHLKVTPTWRIISGPSLTFQTYTRSDKHNLNGNLGTVYREGETWEENSTDIYWDLGIMYDAGTLFTDSRWHTSLKIAGGVPVWSETENSRFTDAVFEDSGYRAYIDGNVSYEMMEGIHLGWYAQYSYEKRFEADPETVYYRNIDGELEMGQGWLPEADTYAFSTGLQVLWKL